MKAIKEVGLGKVVQFILSVLFDWVFAFMVLPPMRVIFLRLFGAQIGKDVVLHRIRFMNLYRGSIENLIIGDYCFLGENVLLDLADKIHLGKHVTLADRTVVLTHVNVGYRDHPLQKYFPTFTKKTTFDDGIFVGVNSVVLAGAHIGQGSFVAAGSVVTSNVSDWTLVGGVPAKPIRKIQ